MTPEQRPSPLAFVRGQVLIQGGLVGVFVGLALLLSDQIGFGLALMLASLVVPWLILRGRVQLQVAWARAAVSLGWSKGRQHLARGQITRGDAEGLAYEVRHLIRSREVATRMSCPWPMANRVRVVAASRKAADQGNWVTTGDPEFDAKYRVEGDAADILSLLDAPTRAAWLEAGEAELRQGQLSHYSGTFARGSTLARTLRKVRDLAGQLERPNDTGQALLAALDKETSAVVRLRQLRLIFDEYGDRPESRELAEEIQHVGDLEERVLAGLYLGPVDGREGLVDLLADLELSVANRQLVVRTLVGWARDAQSASQLGQVLPHAQASLAAVELAGGLRASELVPQLLALLPQAEPHVALALVGVLQDLAGIEAEEALLRALDTADETIAEAAAAALGRLGGKRAFEVLQDLAASTFKPNGLKMAARKAVEALRLRLDHIAVGRLSLSAVAEAAGGLAVAAEDGHLSVTNQESPLVEAGEVPVNEAPREEPVVQRR